MKRYLYSKISVIWNGQSRSRAVPEATEIFGFWKGTKLRKPSFGALLGTKLKISFGQFGTKLHLRAHLYFKLCSMPFHLVNSTDEINCLKYIDYIDDLR